MNERPAFAWSILVAGTVLGVGGGALTGFVFRNERVLSTEMVAPPLAYKAGKTIDIPMDDERGTAHLVGSWTRNPDDGIIVVRIDPNQPPPPIQDGFAAGFTRALLRRIPAEDVHQKNKIDQVAGRRVAHVDVDIEGHGDGDGRIRCAGMTIGGRIVNLFAFHSSEASSADRDFDQLVEKTAGLSDREPMTAAGLGRASGLGAAIVTFPALMIAVFVTNRRRDIWQRTRAREIAREAAS
jgi:hypothetical protein